MAEGKNIEIRIVASGGDQAAAEVRKVSDAQAGMSPAADAATESIARIEAAASRAEAGLEELESQLGITAQACDGAAEETSRLEENVEKIKTVALATAFAQGAQKVSEFAGKIANAGAELDASFGPETAQKIREVSASIETVASGASSVATAYAVGGPVAGALAGTGVMLVETASAWMAMNNAQKSADASAVRAAEMQAKLNDLLENGIESQEGFAAAVLTDEIQDTYKEQTAALKGLIDQLEAAQKITRAGDKADAAVRDNADAEAIRNGAAPEDVKAKRTIDDAELQKRRIDEDFTARQALDLQKRELANELNNKLDVVENDPEATQANKDDSRKAYEAAKASADQSSKELSTTSSVNTQEKREIDTKTAGKVTALGETKTKRLRDEQEDLATAKRDREDSAAIRKTGDPETVKIKRAEFDAGQEIAKLKPGDDSKRQEIEEERQLKVEELMADRANRLKREKEKKAAVAQREEKRTLGEAVTTSGLGMDAAKEAARLGNRKGASELHKKAEAVMANPSDAGNDELVNMMERFVNWAEKNGGGANKKENDRLQAIERKLQTIEHRQKNERTPA